MVSPDLAKIQGVQEWLPPKTITEVYSFLGLVCYYKQIILKFAQIAAPVTQLLNVQPKLKKGVTPLD